MSKKFGFTLAEVLITLGIIGVVAAMTIPTLLSETNDQEYKTGIKKALSALNQAITMNVALNGVDFSGLGSGGTAGGDNVYQMFMTRMNVVSTATGTITGMNGFGATGNYTLFFNDGMAISFPSATSSCAAASTACTLAVDVNGTKKPNTTSTADAAGEAVKDQFLFYFYNQQVVPSNSAARYVLFN